MKRSYRYLAYAGALVLLLSVAALYRQADFVRVLADQLWSCF